MFEIIENSKTKCQFKVRIVERRLDNQVPTLLNLMEKKRILLYFLPGFWLEKWQQPRSL